MDKKTETTIVSWGSMGVLQKKMETTIIGYIGLRVEGGNEQENGNHCSILVI